MVISNAQKEHREPAAGLLVVKENKSRHTVAIRRAVR